MQGGKVLKFNNDYETYLKIYEKRREDGDFLGALRVLKKIFALTGDKEYFLDFGEIYLEMENYAVALFYFFKFLNEDYDTEGTQIYYSISECLFGLNRSDLAGGYWSKVLDEHLDIDQILNTMTAEEFKNITDINEQSLFKLVKNKKIDLIQVDEDVEQGQAFLAKDDYKSALECYEKVPKESEKYLLARNNMSICYYFMEKEDLAMNEFRYILSLNPDDVNAICALMSYFFQYKNYDELEFYFQKSKKISLELEEHLEKMALTYALIEKETDALELFNKFLKEHPYDIKSLFYKGLILYNIKKVDEAISIFEDLVIISNDNFLYKYYLNHIKANRENGEKIYYSMILPMERANRYFKFLEKFETSKYNFTNDDFKDMFEFFISSAMPEQIVYKYILFLLQYGKLFEDFIFDQLLRFEVSPIVKKYIIRGLVLYNYDKRLNVEVDGELKNVVFKKFAWDEKNSGIGFGYAIAFAEASLLINRFTSKLNKTACAIRDYFFETGIEIEEKDDDVIGAVLSYVAGIFKDKDKDEIIALFNVSKDKFNKLARKFNKIIKEEDL